MSEPRHGEIVDPTLPHADRLYLDLKGARERLCRAQMAVPAHWRSDLQAALDHIDLCGSAVCPDQWSRFDQPQEPSLSGRSEGSDA